MCACFDQALILLLPSSNLISLLHHLHAVSAFLPDLLRASRVQNDYFIHSYYELLQFIDFMDPVCVLNSSVQAAGVTTFILQEPLSYEDK